MRAKFALTAMALACLGVAVWGVGIGAVDAADNKAEAARAKAVPDLGICADLHGKRVFPADNLWNTDISKAPVDPNSAAIIASIGVDKGLHPDWGNGVNVGIPYVVVARGQPMVPVTYTAYPGESDKGPFPIPPIAPIEGGPRAEKGADRHVLVIDRDSWALVELYQGETNDGGKSWTASGGAVFDLSSNKLRPAGWSSADAAGLPIFAGLARYDEVGVRKLIDHALRFTVRKSRRAYVPPARHMASKSIDPNLPPMGMRVRLRANYDISRFPAQAQVILQCLKTYGMIMADNGSDWFISGAPNPNWDMNACSAISQVKGKDFEVLKMDGLVGY